VRRGLKLVELYCHGVVLGHDQILNLVFTQLLKKPEDVMINDALDWARSTLPIHISTDMWRGCVTGCDHPTSHPSASRHV